jgi:acid phosphatase family membrane protein YuiD
VQSADGWPAWIVVLGCGLATQLIKVGLYSAAQRRLDLAAVARSNGLPSLHASALGCLAVVTVLRDGWDAGTSSAALVIAVVIIHDAVRLKSAREQQRLRMHDLITTLPAADRFRRHVLNYLDPRAHQPAHVAIGLAFGLLFGLALELVRS